VVPSRLVADRGAFHAAIREIGPGGQTALHDGWHMGATQVAQHLRTDAIARVLLLSDGCANQGLSDPEAIRRHCGTLADTGISTSTYGLGSGFNEDLMSVMARDGQGQAHYGQTAEDLMELFDEEFSLLDALAARRLRLRLDPAPGVQARVLNGYRHEEDGRVILPDLPRDGDVWALVELDIPAQAAGPAAWGRGGLLRHGWRAGPGHDGFACASHR
jgi:Ca-activated chloride channel family protein